MKPSPKDPSLLAEKVFEVEVKLLSLELAIEEIGQPAAQGLRHRLEILKIEGSALQRNFEESLIRGEADAVRVAKIETLLHHIEREESSVRHAADFLHQAAPSSVTFAVEAGAHLVDLYRRGVKRVVGDCHPLGASVFVNHSHENLESEYGLVDPEISASASKIS
jgi:hypothetical protein